MSLFSKEKVMRKKILIVAPDVEPSLPAMQRVRAFFTYFEENDIDCELVPSPLSTICLLRIVIKIYTQGYSNVFITMPPFRGWIICFLPAVRVALDIRDGWSIAMREGYGGTVAPRPFLATIARVVEQVAIKLSSISIVCTPGLQRYHETKITRGKIAVIPNGFSESDFKASWRKRKKVFFKRKNQVLDLVCAGKFSEYGVDTAKKIIRTINDRYSDYECNITILSKSPESDEWISEFIAREGINNISIKHVSYLERDAALSLISSSDIGVAAIRSIDYDFGTKIYDYILCGLPILDYFDGGDIKNYFRGFFDTDNINLMFDLNIEIYTREYSINRSDELRKYVDGM